MELKVSLDQDTVWLTQAQMCELFDKNKRTVSEHIRNIFKEGELEETSVVRKFRTTAQCVKTYITLIVLVLLVADSKPDQKELIIRLIQQFILLRDTEL